MNFDPFSQILRRLLILTHGTRELKLRRFDSESKTTSEVVLEKITLSQGPWQIIFIWKNIFFAYFLAVWVWKYCMKFQMKNKNLRRKNCGIRWAHLSQISLTQNSSILKFPKKCKAEIGKKFLTWKNICKLTVNLKAMMLIHKTCITSIIGNIGVLQVISFTGGEQYKNAHNKNQKRSHWLLFLRQINSTVCSIRTRTIRTFVQYKNAHNKNFCAV